MKTERLQQIRAMQTPVVVMLGVWTVFLLSMGVAWLRVSNTEEFSGQPFHSFELDQGSANTPPQ